MINKILIFLMAVLFIFSCTVPKKTSEEPVKINLKEFFPLKNGCSWIYLVGKDDSVPKSQYLVKLLATDGDSGMIVWGNKTFAYSYKDDGVFNSTENYYTIKNNGDKKWEINKGTAEIIETDRTIKVAYGSFDVLAVKETYPEKRFYSISYYGKGVGLIKFEVYSIEGERGVLIEKMELGSYICSDPE